MLKLECDADGVLRELVSTPAFGRLYADALNWMRRPYVVKTNHWAERQWIASRRGAYAPLLAWEHSFVDRFRKLGVPTHCGRFVIPAREIEGMSPLGRDLLEPHVLGYACDMYHSTLGSDMPNICWEIFQHVGEEIAEQQGLNLLWGGVDRPWSWTCADWVQWRWSPPARQDFDPDVDELRKIPL